MTRELITKAQEAAQHQGVAQGFGGAMTAMYLIGGDWKSAAVVFAGSIVAGAFLASRSKAALSEALGG